MGRNDASNRPSVTHRSRPPPLVDTTCAAPEERPKLETGSTIRLSDNVRESVRSAPARPTSTLASFPLNPSTPLHMSAIQSQCFRLKTVRRGTRGNEPSI